MERPMPINTLWKRLTNNFSDPVMRAKVLALMGGKAIGLILLLTAMRVFLAPAVSAQAPAAGDVVERQAVSRAGPTGSGSDGRLLRAGVE